MELQFGTNDKRRRLMQSLGTDTIEEIMLLLHSMYTNIGKVCLKYKLDSNVFNVEAFEHEYIRCAADLSQHKERGHYISCDESKGHMGGDFTCTCKCFHIRRRPSELLFNVIDSLGLELIFAILNDINESGVNIL